MTSLLLNGHRMKNGSLTNMNSRNETLRDQIATVVQLGHINKLTSVEVADELLDMLVHREITNGDLRASSKPTEEAVRAVRKLFASQ